jgi:hypothetical protein
MSKKNPSFPLTGARNNRSSRCHPDLSTPHDVELHESRYEQIISSSPTLACNGAIRHSLQTLWIIRPATQRCILYISSVGISSSPTLCNYPIYVLVLFTVLLGNTSSYTIGSSNKKPLRCRGASVCCIPLILRNFSCFTGIGTLSALCRWVAGFHRALSLHLS